MTHKFETHVMWHDSRGVECEARVTVTYTRHKGFAGNYVGPGEPDSVEIDSIIATDGGEVSERFLTDPELMDECMEHWMDDVAAAAEARADARRDDLMMEDF